MWDEGGLEVLQASRLLTMQPARPLRCDRGLMRHVTPRLVDTSHLQLVTYYTDTYSFFTCRLLQARLLLGTLHELISSPPLRPPLSSPPLR
jgi:hypothetical protein